MKREISPDYQYYPPQGEHDSGGPAAMKHYHSPSSGLWSPSTPTVSVDGLENYSYHSSPGYQNTSASYNPSPLSPRDWSASSDQPDWKYPLDLPYYHHHHLHHQDQANDGLHIRSLLSADDLPEVSDMNIALDYPRYQSGLEPYTAKFAARVHSPTLFSKTPSFSMPISDNDPSDVFSEMRDGQGMDRGLGFMSPEPPLPSVAGPRAMDASKNGEPYAKLIYRAFMSTPGHAMSLQEIYDWFRVNTDKASLPGRDGWKNSIRHNLSMNHAFVRREKERPNNEGELPVPTPRPAGEARKATEWVLEDWALRDGVQSTTRYRPKGINSSKRGRQSPRSRHVTYHANPKHPNNSRPGRAVSGERGGVATSRGKRRSRRGAQSTAAAAALSQQMGMLNLRLDASPARHLYHFSQERPSGGQASMYEHGYSHQLSSHHDTGLATPVTPEGTPTGLGFPLPSPNLILPTTSLNQTYDVSQYSLGDVAGVYPAGRFFESEDLVYGWNHDGHSQTGNGNPGM
ncbi:hypothetical protein ACHAQA_004839 [Verticillium albo-atrum]